LVIHLQPRFVERPIDVHFLGQLHEVSTITNTWANNPKEVAMWLVGVDLFPVGRPPQTSQASAMLQSKSSDHCVGNVSEGYMRLTLLLPLGTALHFDAKAPFGFRFVEKSHGEQKSIRMEK